MPSTDKAGYHLTGSNNHKNNSELWKGLVLAEQGMQGEFGAKQRQLMPGTTVCWLIANLYSCLALSPRP